MQTTRQKKKTNVIIIPPTVVDCEPNIFTINDTHTIAHWRTKLHVYLNKYLCVYLGQIFGSWCRDRRYTSQTTAELQSPEFYHNTETQPTEQTHNKTEPSNTLAQK